MSRIASEIIYRLKGDDADLQKTLKQAESRVTRLGQSFVSTGRTLTRSLTGPILAAGTAAIGLAVNAGNVADRLLDLEQITGLSTDTLQEFKNVAIVAGVDFESLVGVLQRFSSRLRQIDQEGSPANEAVRRLGINVRDTNGQLRDADDLFPEFLGRLNEIEDITERNALAQELFGRSLQDLAPVLALTSDEIARARDEARSLGLVQDREALVSANNFRIQVDQLKASIAAQALELGTNLIPTVERLIPVVSDVIRNIAGLVNRFTDLPKPVQDSVLVMAGLLAALGPVLTITGNLLIALPKLKLAFAALTGPVGLTVTAIAGLTGGLALLINRQRELNAINLEERFGGVASEIGITTQEASGLVGVIEQINFQFDQFGNLSTNDLRQAIGAIAQDAGITAREFIRLALETGNISEGLRTQLNLINRQLGPVTQTRDLQSEIAGWIEQGRQNTEAVNQQQITQELERQAREAERRATAEALYLANRQTVLGILSQEQTEIERIQAQIDELQRTPWATGQLENDRLKAIEVLRERQAELIDLERQKEIDRINAVEQLEIQARQRRLEALEAEDELKKQLHEAEEARIEELKAKEQQRIMERVQFSAQAYSAITGFANALFEREIQNIKNSELAEEDKAKEIAKIKRRQAEADKANTIAQIIISTALAVVRALPNVFLAATTGVLGGIQLATAIAQPIPQFATGGSFTVPQGFQNDSFPLAFAQSGERVTVETPAQAASADNRRGNTFVIEQVVATPGGLRELNRLLNKYGDIEQLRTGDI